MPWGVDVRTAFADAIVGLGEDFCWERSDGGAESIEAELTTIGVEAFPFLELVGQLGLLEAYGKRIEEKLREALRLSEDDRVKLLKMKLARFEQELAK